MLLSGSRERGKWESYWTSLVSLWGHCCFRLLPHFVTWFQWGSPLLREAAAPLKSGWSPRCWRGWANSADTPPTREWGEERWGEEGFGIRYCRNVQSITFRVFFSSFFFFFLHFIQVAVPFIPAVSFSLREKQLGWRSLSCNNNSNGFQESWHKDESRLKTTWIRSANVTMLIHCAGQSFQNAHCLYTNKACWGAY